MDRRKFIKDGTLTTAGLVLGSSFLTGKDKKERAMQIFPNWKAEGRPLAHSWEGLGNIDQMRWMNRKDCLDQLEKAYKELNMRHVRAVGIHHDDMYGIDIDPRSSMDKSGLEPKRRNNWQVIDGIFDGLIDIGINPMYTSAFTPTVMSTGEQSVFQTVCNVTPPKNYNEWADYITASLRHFKYRYGKRRMDDWYYEVWNEPNLQAFYGGDQAEFFKLWEVTYKAIKQVDPDWRIGGPSTARAEWIHDFLNYAKRKDCYPDYIIGHCYNNDSEWGALSPFDGPQEDKANQSPHFLPGVVGGVEKLMQKHGFEGEVHWNEWGRSWFPYDDMRETSNESAFIVKSMAEVHDKAKYFAYWCLSDIYNQAGYGAETFHGNYGLFNLQGLKKPSYYAFELLGKMGDRTLPHTGENIDRLNNAWVSKSDKGYQAMFYAYGKDFQLGDSSGTTSVELQLPDDFGRDRIDLYKVGNTENNVLSKWSKAGKPDYLKYDQKNAWLSDNEIKKSNRDLSITERKGKKTLKFEFESPGIAFVDIKT